jgi:hypothetical protein
MAYVSNAWKQTKRGGPKNDSPTTAGVGGKVPRVGVNKSDLEAQGIAHGWTVGPVTPEQVKAMSSAALRWHEEFNNENLEKAFTSQTVDKYNKTVRVNQANKRMYEGGASPEESQAAFDAGDRFAQRYAQFVRSVPNAKVIMEYMEEANLDARKVESYMEAFEHLAPLGKLALNPSAIGAGSETEIYDVAKHRNYHLLMQAQRRPSEIDRMSADEFKAAAQKTHPDLRDKRVSPIVAAKNAKTEATAQHFQQAADHTNKANVVTVVDYPENEPSGHQAHSKFRFKQYVKTLSASEFQEKLGDPTFVAALDRSADGNK